MNLKQRMNKWMGKVVGFFVVVMENILIIILIIMTESVLLTIWLLRRVVRK